MSDLNDVSRAIGSLEAKVENLTTAVTTLNDTVQGLQQSKWTARGVAIAIATVAGGAGGKIVALFGGSPTPHP